MNAHRRAIVAGADLRAPVIGGRDSVCLRLTRRVALVAEGLPLIGTDLHGARSVGQLRKRQQPDGKMHLLAAIEDGQRICRRRARRTEMRSGGPGLQRRPRGASGGRPWQGIVGWSAKPARVMCQGPAVFCGWTRSRIAPLKCMPWQRRQSSISRRFAVVVRVGEDLRVGGAVRTGMPRRVLMLMAVLAVRRSSLARLTSRRRIASGGCRACARGCDAAWWRGSLHGNPCTWRCDAAEVWTAFT